MCVLALYSLVDFSLRLRRVVYAMFLVGEAVVVLVAFCHDWWRFRKVELLWLHPCSGRGDSREGVLLVRLVALGTRLSGAREIAQRCVFSRTQHTGAVPTKVNLMAR